MLGLFACAGATAAKNGLIGQFYCDARAITQRVHRTRNLVSPMGSERNLGEQGASRKARQGPFLPSYYRFEPTWHGGRVASLLAIPSPVHVNDRGLSDWQQSLFGSVCLHCASTFFSLRPIAAAVPSPPSKLI